MSDSVLSPRLTVGSWARNASALRIEYGLGVLEEIRRTIQEGFHKIPHGGVETGGVLYGKWDSGLLTISGWRPMQCEHPLGPRFQLSREDEAALAAQLATPVEELADCRPVGWFASHSRGALQLRGPDLDLHSKFFSEPWQPILLLCAGRNQPMQAAFYSRAEGTLAVGAEVQSFEVIPNPGAVPRRTGKRSPQEERAERAHPERTSQERTARERTAGDSTRIVGARMGPLPEMTPSETPTGPELVEHGSGSWSPIDTSRLNGPWLSRTYDREGSGAGAILNGEGQVDEPAMDAIDEMALAGEDLPKFTGGLIPDEGFRWKRVAWATMWLSVAAGGVYAIPRFAMPLPTASLALQMNEVKNGTPGQIAIHWTLKDSDRVTVQGGELLVMDGGETRRFLLSAAEMQTGALTYWRQSGKVDARLTVNQEEGKPILGEAHLEGARPAASAKDPALQKLRQTLADAKRQGRKLERQLAQDRKTRRR